MKRRRKEMNSFDFFVFFPSQGLGKTDCHAEPGSASLRILRSWDSNTCLTSSLKVKILHFNKRDKEDKKTRKGELQPSTPAAMQTFSPKQVEILWAWPGWAPGIWAQISTLEQWEAKWREQGKTTSPCFLSPLAHFPASYPVKASRK